MSPDYLLPKSSERLTTRLLTVDDVEALEVLFSDLEYTRFLPFDNTLSAREKAAYFVTRALTRYHEGTYGLHALIETTTNRFVGTCGLLKHTIEGVEETETGYHLFKDCQGKGFATEAVNLFLAYGFTNTPVNSIIALIDPDNHPSRAVVRRCGFAEEKLIKMEKELLHIHRLQKVDFNGQSLQL